MKLKIFTGYADVVEKEFNEFIQTISIINIVVSSDGKIFLFYEELKNGPTP